MTLEELKAEAKAQGYCLMPIKETVKFVPCTCGCNRRRMWHKTGMIQYECMKCGKTSDWRKAKQWQGWRGTG